MVCGCFPTYNGSWVVVMQSCKYLLPVSLRKSLLTSSLGQCFKHKEVGSQHNSFQPLLLQAKLALGSATRELPGAQWSTWSYLNHQYNLISPTFPAPVLLRTMIFLSFWCFMSIAHGINLTSASYSLKGLFASTPPCSRHLPPSVETKLYSWVWPVGENCRG